MILEFSRWGGWYTQCLNQLCYKLEGRGFVPDCVTGIFHWHNLFGSTMALGLTKSLTEMSTRNTSWGVKAAGTYSWQPYHLHVPIILKPESLNLLEPAGPVQDCNGIALSLLFSTDFQKNTEILSFVCLSNGSRVVPCRWTKVIVAFLNFTKNRGEFLN